MITPPHTPPSQETLAANAAPMRLWDWAVERYRPRGVSELLVDYQDRFGFNVSLVLWCCWCADYSRLLSDLEVRKALDITCSWAHDVSVPLRQVRRALKTVQFRALATGPGDFYSQVKAVELAAEKLELSLYEGVGVDGHGPCVGTPGEHGDIISLARRNITTYVALAGIARVEGFSITLIDDLATEIFKRNETECNVIENTPPQVMADE